MRKRIYLFIKRLIWGSRPKSVQRIKFGIGEGLLMSINPYSESQRIFGLFEKEIHSYILRFACSCDYFFDIGAYDGYYSLIYRKYNKQGKIFICDGSQGVSKLQKENFKLNNIRLDNIFFTNKFIWDEIINSQNIKIDDLINETNKTIFFKIDVDGGELNVLKSGIKQIENNQCYFIIETHSLRLEQDCINFFKNLQYESKIIKNYFWRSILPEHRTITHNRWLLATKKVIRAAGDG